jgi:hypothetical protein
VPRLDRPFESADFDRRLAIDRFDRADFSAAAGGGGPAMLTMNMDLRMMVFLSGQKSRRAMFATAP